MTYDRELRKAEWKVKKLRLLKILILNKLQKVIVL
jgi:hypothetical protein